MDIKKKIHDRGMTLAEVAEKIGIKAPTLTKTINSANPKFSSLQKIADAIGISVSELIGDSFQNKEVSITCPHCGETITMIITNGENKDKTVRKGC